MNFKFLIGRSLTSLEKAIRKSKLSIVQNNYPFGRDFVYDLSRYFNKEIGTIVDAGANVGSVSKDFSIYFPKAQVYAFEPISSTFEILQKNTGKYGNIKPIQLGLGASNFEIEIPLNLENTINSIAAPPREGDNGGTEKIKVVSLDNFFNENSTTNIDILKIDVEGYEFEVLKGAQGIMQKQLKAIVLEVGYQRGNDKVHFSDVENFMESHHFQCCGIYDISKSRDKRRLYYSNNLYIRKEFI